MLLSSWQRLKWLLIIELILIVNVRSDYDDYDKPKRAINVDKSETTTENIGEESTNGYDLQNDEWELEKNEDNIKCQFNQNSKCGILNEKGKAPNDELGRIIGGNIAKPYKYPWFVFLIFKEGNEEFTCGGSILNQRWIISAAHCLVIKHNKGILLKRQLLRVIPEINDYTPDNWPNGIEFLLNKIFYPDKYIGKNKVKNKEFDILLIKTKHCISFGEKIRPVCYCPKPMSYVDQKNCLVTGFGKQHQDIELPPKHLKEVRVNITKLNCQKDMVCASGNWIGGQSVKIGQGKFNYSHNQHRGTCRGDSGGGLVCPLLRTGTGTNNPKRYAIVGTVSHNPKDGPEKKNCGWGGSPTRFASIQFNHDWIDNIIKKNEDKLDKLDCTLNLAVESQSSDNSANSFSWWSVETPRVNDDDEPDSNRNFPWIVSIRIQQQRNDNDNVNGFDGEIDDDGLWFHRCTGTLLSGRWVITTATCLGLSRRPKDIRVFGVTDYGDRDGTEDNAGKTIRSLTVLEIVFHPDFNPQAELGINVDAGYNDLALLRVQKFSLTRTSIAPVAWRPDALSQVEKGECLIGRQTKNIQEGFVYLKRIIENSECAVQNFREVLEICAATGPSRQQTMTTIENQDDDDAQQTKEKTRTKQQPDCSKGNAGGPLICRLRNDPGLTYILVGVVKSDIACSWRDNDRQATIAVNIDSYIPWLVNVTLVAEFDKMKRETDEDDD